MVRPVTAALLAAMVPLAFGGCVSEEERLAREQAQWVADQQECADLGFEPGTDPFADCLLRLREIRATERGGSGLGVGLGVGFGF